MISRSGNLENTTELSKLMCNYSTSMPHRFFSLQLKPTSLLFYRLPNLPIQGFPALFTHSKQPSPSSSHWDHTQLLLSYQALSTQSQGSDHKTVCRLSTNKTPSSRQKQTRQVFIRHQSVPSFIEMYAREQAPTLRVRLAKHHYHQLTMSSRCLIAAGSTTIATTTTTTSPTG